MAGISATTLANGIPSKWADFDIACNEEMVFANKIKEYDLGPGGTFYVPYIAAVTAGTVSAGNGNSLTFPTPTEGRATLTPVTRSAQVEIEKQAAKRAVSDPTSPYKQQIAAALATIIDADCLVDVSTLTSSIINAAAGITRADITEAYGKGATNAKNQWKVGSSDVFGIVHPSQINNLLNQDALVSSQYRGGTDVAVRTGWIVEAFGVKWYESGNVYVSGGNAYNVIAAKGAFGIAYNWRSEMEPAQPFHLVMRYIVSADFAHTAVRENYAVQLLSPNT